MKGRLVLIVDDNPDIRTLAGAVLQGAGYSTVLAASGEDALIWLAGATRLPDVVVLDVQMPETDGWTTLARIRDDERLAHLPVVLCTVNAGPEDRERGLDLRADKYLAKPFAIDQFVMVVDELARAHHRATPEACRQP